VQVDGISCTTLRPFLYLTQQAACCLACKTAAVRLFQLPSTFPLYFRLSASVGLFYDTFHVFIEDVIELVGYCCFGIVTTSSAAVIYRAMARANILVNLDEILVMETKKCN
jgi:hypothetical protein